MRVSVFARISLLAFADLLSSVNAFNIIGSPVALYYLQKHPTVKGD
jgi:hypothetical protein